MACRCTDRVALAAHRVASAAWQSYLAVVRVIRRNGATVERCLCRHAPSRSENAVYVNLLELSLRSSPQAKVFHKRARAKQPKQMIESDGAEFRRELDEFSARLHARIEEFTKKGEFINVHTNLLNQIRNRSDQLKSRVVTAQELGTSWDLIKAEAARDYSSLFDNFLELQHVPAGVNRDSQDAGFRRVLTH
jgi:hypothetical protein